MRLGFGVISRSVFSGSGICAIFVLGPYAYDLVSPNSLMGGGADKYFRRLWSWEKIKTTFFFVCIEQEYRERNIYLNADSWTCQEFALGIHIANFGILLMLVGDVWRSIISFVNFKDTSKILLTFYKKNIRIKPLIVLLAPFLFNYTDFS